MPTKFISEITFIILMLLCFTYSSAEASDGSASAKKDQPVLEVQIKDVVDNPKEYNKKHVALEGKVMKVKYTTGGKDNLPFTVFKVKDGDDNEVNVYYEARHLPISKGDSVKIVGKFWKQKKYLIYKIKNVIKASVVEAI